VDSIVKAGKQVFAFEEGDGKNKKLLGGKGANLCEMTQIGLNVPPGFTITTLVCTYYYKNKKTYPKGLKEEAQKALRNIEKGKKGLLRY